MRQNGSDKSKQGYTLGDWCINKELIRNNDQAEMQNFLIAAALGNSSDLWTFIRHLQILSVDVEIRYDQCVLHRTGNQKKKDEVKKDEKLNKL